MLANREHSRQELERKLSARFEADQLALALDRLTEQGLLSDRRFAEEYAGQRLRKGYGPLVIRQELVARGIDEAGIDQALAALAPDWSALLARVHQQKYGESLPKDYHEAAKRGRFLTQRGFFAEEIHELLFRHLDY